MIWENFQNFHQKFFHDNHQIFLNEFFDKAVPQSSFGIFPGVSFTNFKGAPPGTLVSIENYIRIFTLSSECIWKFLQNHCEFSRNSLRGFLRCFFGNTFRNIIGKFSKSSSRNTSWGGFSIDPGIFIQKFLMKFLPKIKSMTDIPGKISFILLKYFPKEF